MKLLTSLIVLLAGTNALACAGCLDVFPETLVMDSEVSKEILSSQPVLNDKNQYMSLSEISCTKPNLFGEPKESTCTLKGTISSPTVVEAKISNTNATVLYNQLQNLTVEVDGQVSEEWVRTGKRSKITLLNQTTEESTISIPHILSGKLSCPLIKDKKRCEIELTSLSVSLIFAQ